MQLPFALQRAPVLEVATALGVARNLEFHEEEVELQHVGREPPRVRRPRRGKTQPWEPESAPGDPRTIAGPTGYARTHAAKAQPRPEREDREAPPSQVAAPLIILRGMVYDHRLDQTSLCLLYSRRDQIATRRRQAVPK